MADTSIVLNNGSGGASLATYQDSVVVQHQKVVLETQSSSSDPVHVNASNPLPVNENFGGVPASVNTGNADTGTLRVVLATNQPSLTNAQPVAQSGSWTVSISGTPAVTIPQSNNTADYDTGAGTQTMTMWGIALPASGGSVPGGTATNPLQVSLANTAANGTAVKVDGSAVTQPISAASLPLPSGAATAAKQPALGTAGTPSADVISVQGVTSMTALKVDGSGVTQPVSGTITATGTVTANQGTAAAGSSAWPVNLVEDTTNTVVHPGDATNKAIRVNIVAGAGSGGTALSDGTTFTRGTTSETPVGGIAETSNPTLTTGKAAALSLDLNGNLRVVTSGSGGGSSINDGSTFTRGTTAETTAGGIAETSAPSLTTGKAASLSLNLSGGLRVDGSGVTQPVSGTVTANIGTSGSLALDASVTGLQVSQGSTTSGQKGDLVQGAVTTGAPTYTTAQTSPLSLTTAGALRVDASATTQPVSISGNQAVNVAQLAGTTTDTNSGNKSAGTLRVVIATDQPSMTNAQPVSQSGTWTVQPGNTANTTPWLTTNVPGGSPGSTRSRIKAAASTNATSLKASAGVVLSYALYNNTASSKCFKFYDKASAPTVGTDTPAFTIIIPASGGANIDFANGVPFSTGIAYAITGLVADSDTTVTAVDDVHGTVIWK